MNSEQKDIVSRLQDNLFTIRRLAGWTAEELADRLDVTRQTIYNLERGKPMMSWIQYLAIRKLIEIEIEAQDDNPALEQAVLFLLDDEELSVEKYEELQGALKTIANGMSKSQDKSIALKLAVQTVGFATAGITAGILSKSTGTGITTWLSLLRSFKK